MKILVINAGSSSLKYQLINTETHQVMAKGLCDRIGIEGSMLEHRAGEKEKVKIPTVMKDHKDAIRAVIDILTDKDQGVIKDMSEITAVGHRVVHGGEKFNGSMRITEAVKNALEECIDLAPLHNPPNLIGINACEEAMPGVPMVAVFDTAFHQTISKEAYMYALPYEYYEKYKIRRYGFHGTSHKYVAGRVAEIVGKPLSELKIVNCHLGNGSSVCAINKGKSVDTSMGFTPLAGLPMGTRCGDIDPAIVTFLMDKENLSFKQINEIMNKKSGVLGVSGVSSDYRDVEKEAMNGNARADIALKMFILDVKKYIGGYAAEMGGLDVISFTAGVGENTGWIRAAIVEGLEFLGVEIDPEANKVKGEEKDISAPGAKVKTLVVPTNEELMIALETQALI